MRRIIFLFWFLAYSLPVVSALENPTPTADWYNSSPDDAHQKESLAHGWFKYPSGHWGHKFHYGCLFTALPTEPTLVRPYASLYLLKFLVGYYLLGYFSFMFGRFTYLGHLRHLTMVTVPIGSVIAGLNVGALAHQLGSLFPAKRSPPHPPLLLIILTHKLLLLHNIYDDSEQEHSDVEEANVNDKSFLNVPKTVAVSYKLFSDKTTTTKKFFPEAK
ncbi:hypothetical protein DSO57_1017328 [Entomophthora muscae]|uniref:Uncharacterized protein n=1 Tax=Entomophthora muscae TaxID=34485 RepID=A0ACC2RVQ7_9FUNG|nr:hypothetical protein DSO57_1017328 [Entomophthora muscae]